MMQDSGHAPNLGKSILERHGDQSYNPPLLLGCLLAIMAKDEEIFFYWISIEVQLAVLHMLGFPEQKFIGFKAREMHNVQVYICT